MRIHHLMTAFAAAALLVASFAQAKGMGKTADFEIFAMDEGGGGWVLHHIPIKGDMLRGCTDVLGVDECKPVPLPDFTHAATLSMIHISEDSAAAWLKVSVPISGDFLMACYDPEGGPYCEKVRLEVRPPGAKIAREWPHYGNPEECPCGGGGGGADAGGGGGLMGGMMGGGGPSIPVDDIIEDAARADMWLSAAVAVPGPINLYACRNLDGDPECRLTVPDWFLIDREDLGFKKVEEVDLSEGSGKYCGILVDDISELSIVEDSDIRLGDVIVRVGGFPIKNAKHFKGLLSQFPATYTIPIELENGDRLRLRPRRLPEKD